MSECWTWRLLLLNPCIGSSASPHFLSFTSFRSADSETEIPCEVNLNSNNTSTTTPPPTINSMASPPAGSPPSSNFAPPRQRPNLGLALPSKSSSRKPSLASTPSAHPLRQTSFPPPDSLEAQSAVGSAQYSPTGSGSLDGFSDAEIRSAVSGPVADENFTTGKKRKRGEKRGRGRPSKNQNGPRTGSVSLANGEDGRGSRRGAPSVVTGDGADAGEEEEEDDDDEEGAAGMADDKEMDLEQDNRHRYLFREAVGAAHQHRYDSFNKVKLRTADVRRLVNATLSQSVPQNVVTVVGAYTKMFAGMLIENAREVQSEWMAVNEKRPDGEENRAYKRMKMMYQLEEEEEAQTAKEPKINGESVDKTPNGKAESAEKESSKKDGLPDGDYDPDGQNNVPGDTQPNSSPSDKPNGKADDTQTSRESKKSEDDIADGFEHVQPSAWGLAKYLEECDRGPLLPDHLREALRRYKKSRNGGTVGFTGISLERPEIAAPRMGGKRLFK